MGDLFLGRCPCGQPVVGKRKRCAACWAKNQVEAARRRNRKVEASPTRKEYRRTLYRTRRAEMLEALKAPAACEICKTPFGTDRGTSPRFDHNHDTGKFRGWLCHQCNVALGLLRDSPELLRHAANYVEARSG